MKNLKLTVDGQNSAIQEREQRINQMRRELHECKRREALDTTTDRSHSPFSNFGGRRRSNSPFPAEHTPVAADRSTIEPSVAHEVQ